MEEIRLEVIYHTDNYGNKEILTITNNATKWLNHSNSFKDKSDYETLKSFDIQPIYYMK